MGERTGFRPKGRRRFRTRAQATREPRVRPRAWSRLGKLESRRHRPPPRLHRPRPGRTHAWLWASGSPPSEPDEPARPRVPWRSNSDEDGPNPGERGSPPPLAIRQESFHAEILQPLAAPATPRRKPRGASRPAPQTPIRHIPRQGDRVRFPAFPDPRHLIRKPSVSQSRLPRPQRSAI